MTDLLTLDFYATPEHDCSYLPEQKATTLFADPNVIMTTALYSELSQLGFRRSGNQYYRPHCASCQACTPIRVPVADFRPSRSQKRVLRKNQHLQCQIIPADFHEDHYLLYEKYIIDRHSDGDMYPPSREQYRSFLVDGHQCTQFIELSEDGHLCGVAVCDQLEDGLSAIYTFFDPELTALSLGTFAVLWQIQEAQRRNQTYLYLGFYINNCRKMSYKNQYKPFEARINNHWLSEVQLQSLTKTTLPSDQ